MSSEYARATCVVCLTRFRHESGTELTCSRICDQELEQRDIAEGKAKRCVDCEDVFVADEICACGRCRSCCREDAKTTGSQHVFASALLVNTRDRSV